MVEKIPDMKAGETFQIKYTVKNTDDKEIVFRSGDTNVISVDEKGLLTAVSGGKTFDCAVTVMDTTISETTANGKPAVGSGTKQSTRKRSNNQTTTVTEKTTEKKGATKIDESQFSDAEIEVTKLP